MEITWLAFFTQLLNGLVLGLTFALLAIGLSIIFGMLSVVNFAHGAFYMMGAYFAIFTLGITGNFWASMVVSFLSVGLVGVITEYFTLKPLYGKDHILPLLITFGFSMASVGAIHLIFGSNPKSLKVPDLISGPINLGFIYYSKYNLFVLFSATILAVLVWLLIEKTNLGMLIRAGTQDRMMARGLGINVDRLFTLVFGLGTGLAALGGVISAPIRGAYPEMGMEILIQSFVVVTVGGIGSFWGSIVAALIIGEAITISILIWPPLASISIYLLMALILLMKPEGLFGVRV
jgi:branched-chain amino acid transport system permease protein